jgi:hypothetical protein
MAGAWSTSYIPTAWFEEAYTTESIPASTAAPRTVA